MKNEAIHFDEWAVGDRAKHTIVDCLKVGSQKDGKETGWWKHGSLYHLVKAAAHLAMHIKFRIDARGSTEENHLHKAISRLAMALAMEDNAQ